MSVTFTIDGNATGDYGFKCLATGELFVADSYDAIEIERACHLLLCETCDEGFCWSSPRFDVPAEFDVNMSTVNAVSLLAVLGIEYDPCEIYGVMGAEQFLGHVLIAMAQDRDDSGIAAVVDACAGGSTFIDCGRRAGYVADRLAALHALATEAARLGRDVCWS